jgi:hypothetical protein
MALVIGSKALLKCWSFLINFPNTGIKIGRRLFNSPSIAESPQG